MATGFTLIELLIVVAIIAILAAIAVPNFLEAQTRSKVSRVRADLRTLAVGIEAYAVDNRRYMPYPEWGQHTGPRYLNALSTPIAYVSAGSGVVDPFRRRGQRDTDGEQAPRYGYFDPHSSPVQWAMSQPDAYYEGIRLPGPYKWTLISIGPDHHQNMDSSTPPRGVIHYEATNGTVSEGDIWRLGP